MHAFVCSRRAGEFNGLPEINMHRLFNLRLNRDGILLHLESRVIRSLCMPVLKNSGAMCRFFINIALNPS